jgi:hypothetical protein
MWGSEASSVARSARDKVRVEAVRRCKAVWHPKWEREHGKIWMEENTACWAPKRSFQAAERRIGVVLWK